MHLVFQQLDCDPLTLIQSRTFPRMSANALITALNCNAHLSPFSLSCTTCNVHTAIMHLVMHPEHFHSQDFDFGLLGGGCAHLHASPSPRCALRSCDLPIPPQMHHFSPTRQETFVFDHSMQLQLAIHTFF